MPEDTPRPFLQFRQQLREACQGDERRLFALIDAARIRGLEVLLAELKVPRVCLYRGDAERDYKHVAPHLVKLELESDFAPWFVVEPEAMDASMFVVAPLEMEALRTHFRRFLLIHDARGKEVFFRFYDPRVIEPFLKASTPAGQAAFFGPVTALLARDPEAPPDGPPLKAWLPPKSPAAAPPDAGSKFRLRPEHEQVFSAGMLASYEQRCANHLRGRYPNHAGPLDDEKMKKLLSAARSWAGHLETPAGRDVTLLAEILLLGGTQQSLEEVKALPAGQRPPSLQAMRDKLFREAYP